MPSLLSAASTALPESSEISRSLLGPPINTATLPNSLIRFSRDRACIESMGGCFALPHRPLRGTASGSPHQYRHLAEFTHTLLARSCMHRVDGRLLRPPAPAAARHRVGLAPSIPPPCRIHSYASRAIVHASSRWAAASPSRTGRCAAPRRARPINTATLPNSLIRFSRDRARIESMGGCFALPHRPLRGTASGSPHQYRHLAEFTHTTFSPMILTSGCNATPVISATTR